MAPATQVPPTPYIHFGGNARDALSFYADVFGGRAQLHTFSDFSRTDGPGDAVAHGSLEEGPITIFASDVAGDEVPFRADGLLFSLLGAADPGTLRQWFQQLSDGGRIVDDLQQRPWGDWDGQVVDRFGLHWLIGFSCDAAR